LYVSLTGNSTYSGGTLIFEGTLVVDNDKTGSGTGSGVVDVMRGGTLRGNGKIDGMIEVRDGGMDQFKGIRPGKPNQSPGDLTAAGGLTIQDGGTYVWELGQNSDRNPGTDFSVISLTGGDLRLGAMAQSGLFYVRFMDDILVLAPTRWKLRRAVRVVNEQRPALDLEQHPDKTFIGRIAKGFDFLDYHFDGAGMTVARATVERFVEHTTRLSEQERRTPHGPALLGRYVRRWMGWCGAELFLRTASPTQRAGSLSSTRRRNKKPVAAGMVISAAAVRACGAGSMPNRRRPNRAAQAKPARGRQTQHGRPECFHSDPSAIPVFGNHRFRPEAALPRVK
jgi:autotransporter-associated beta strand protein